MAADIAAVLGEADRVLEPGGFEDYCLNGLQVPGGEAVRTLATGVSANLALFELAAAEGAELLIVHHGLFWGSGVRAIDPPLGRRLALLLRSGIALAAYHLPLDAHPQLGNNAALAQGLEASPIEPFGLHAGRPIGCIATLAAGGLAIEGLAARVGELTNREPLVLDFGPPSVLRVAIVSGAGGDYIDDAAAAGADALLTGELSERSTGQAREAGLHVLAAGHHATETFGVRRLGEHLAERFGLRHVFLDVPNPL